MINDKGERIYVEEEIIQVFIEFYKRHLGYRMENRMELNKKIMRNGSLITANQKDELGRPFQKTEVRDTFFEINRNKAPGIDGFNAIFF